MVFKIIGPGDKRNNPFFNIRVQNGSKPVFAIVVVEIEVVDADQLVVFDPFLEIFRFVGEESANR